jgi:hypothetical protein
MRFFTTLAVMALVHSAAAPAAAQVGRTDDWKAQTFVYPLDRLATAGLPSDLVDRRSRDPLLDECRGQNRAVGIFLPLIMLTFNTLLGEIDRGMKAAEKRRLDALSDSYSANSAIDSFPLAPRGSAMSCVVIDQVETGSGGETRDRATYVLALRRLGSTAFVVEPLAARLDRSSVVMGQADRRVNVDLSFSLATVTPPAKGEMPSLYGYPAYTVRLSALTVGQPHSTERHAFRSIVLPLPQDNRSPTSLVAAVTESHVSLTRERERVALQQANRKALFEVAAEMLKTKLGE